MEMSAEINELTAALVLSQAGFSAIGKDKAGYNYKYATLQNIVENTRPILVENGVTVIQFPINQEFSIGVTTLVAHVSGQWVKSSFVMPTQQSKNLSEAQEAGKVITYARRYAYAAAVGIVVDEDTDAARAQGKPAKTQTAAKTTPPAKATTTETISPAGLKQFNTVGHNLYGDSWDDKRPGLVDWVSGGSFKTSKSLTPEMFKKLVDGMQKKIEARPVTQGALIAGTNSGAHSE
jgi:hypothetical protein